MIHIHRTKPNSRIQLHGIFRKGSPLETSHIFGISRIKWQQYYLRPLSKRFKYKIFTGGKKKKAEKPGIKLMTAIKIAIIIMKCIVAKYNKPGVQKMFECAN